MIEVERLRKVFRVARRRPGMVGALATLLRPDVEHRVAVDGVTFRIDQGELVGYVGPNGAGKSTTIKMLTGILVPTAGNVRVGGLVPHERRTDNARQIGVVFGQRTQLWWDLPTIDSFELLRDIYHIPPDRYRRNLEQFTDLLTLGPFLETPVRQLSLGQRMRAELSAALLHDPPILFLDEPTIGLDVVAKERIRQFIASVHRERTMTILLTTHDMSDIEKLCSRVLLIDHGRIVYDGALARLRERFGTTRVLVVDFEGNPPEVSVDGAELTRREDGRCWFRFDSRVTTASELIRRLSLHFPIHDLTVQEPAIEEIIRHIYEHGLQPPP